MPERLLEIDGELWARRVGLASTALVVLVGLCDVFLYYFEWLPSEIIRRSFNVGLEESFGTWVSTSLSLFTGLVGVGIAAASIGRETVLRSACWCLVALFFLYVSFDDAAKFHERVGTAFRVKFEVLTASELKSWFPSYSWQLFVAPFFLLMGGFLAWFFATALPRDLRVWLFAGLAMFGIAMVGDFVEGVLRDASERRLHLVRLVEELLEMFGTCAIFYALLATLARRVTLFVRLADNFGKEVMAEEVGVEPTRHGLAPRRL